MSCSPVQQHVLGPPCLFCRQSQPRLLLQGFSCSGGSGSLVSASFSDQGECACLFTLGKGRHETLPGSCLPPQLVFSPVSGHTV